MKILPMLLTLAIAALTACQPQEQTGVAEHTLLSPGAPPSSAGYVERLVPLRWQPSDGWTQVDYLGNPGRTRACGLDEPDIATFVLELDEGSLPHGATLTGGAIFVAPCDAPRAALPDNRLVFAFDIVDFSGKPTYSSGGMQDQSQTVAEYVKPHEVALTTTDMPPLNRELERMLLRVENEYGLDALGGMKILGAKIWFKP